MPAVNTFWAATTSCKAPNMSPLPHPKHAPAATSDHSGRTKPLCRKAANSAPARKSAHDKTGERHRRAFGWRKATTPETARETRQRRASREVFKHEKIRVFRTRQEPKIASP